MLVLTRRKSTFACILPFLFLVACTLEPPIELNQVTNTIDFELPPRVDSVKFAKCMAPQAAKLKQGFNQFIAKLKTRSEGRLLLADIGLDDSQVIDTLVDAWFQIQALKFNDPAIIDVADTLKQSINIDQSMQLLDELTHTYLKAYFTKPLDIKPSEVNKTKLRVDMAAILNRDPQDQKISNLLDLLEPQLKSSTNTLSRFGGFIDRNGSKFGFPGVTIPTDSLKVNYSQISADMMRIFLDALRDGLAPIPVLKNSTAASFQHDFDILQFGSLEQPISLEWHMDHQDPSKMLNISISPQQFENIEAKARQAEATAASRIGKAIRGGSMGSLNNEAVAQMLETAAGVLAKHTTQRAQWCLLAQNKYFD